MYEIEVRNLVLRTVWPILGPDESYRVQCIPYGAIPDGVDLHRYTLPVQRCDSARKVGHRVKAVTLETRFARRGCEVGLDEGGRSHTGHAVHKELREIKLDVRRFELVASGDGFRTY